MLEWVNAEGATPTHYCGPWSDDSKQDAAATTLNIHWELCVDGNTTQLLERLVLGRTVWKGTEGTTMSYHCGKSINSQGKLLAELHVMIDVKVEASGHGKWWLDSKMGFNKRFCGSASRACVAL